MTQDIQKQIDENITKREKLTQEYNQELKELASYYGIDQAPNPTNNVGEAMYAHDAAPLQIIYDAKMERLMTQYQVLFLILNDIARPGTALHPDVAIKKLACLGDAGAHLKKLLEHKLYNGAYMHIEMKRNKIQFLDFWYLKQLLAQMHKYANQAINARAKNNSEMERKYLAASRKCADRTKMFHESVINYVSETKVATK